MSRGNFQREDQEESANVSKTVTLFLFRFEFLTYEYICWPDMYRGHLTKTNMRTICLASQSSLLVFFTIVVPISSKQHTKHVMTLSVCKICPNFNIWGCRLRSKRFGGSRLSSKIILGLQAFPHWDLVIYTRVLYWKIYHP